MKSIKLDFMNLLISLLLASSLGMKTNNLNKDIYYKNKFYDYGDEPILLEKASVHKGYINPDILIPKYKTIAKSGEKARKIPELNYSSSAEVMPSNQYIPTSSSTNISESETEEGKGIEFSSELSKSTYKNYKRAGIIKDDFIYYPNSINKDELALKTDRDDYVRHKVHNNDKIASSNKNEFANQTNDDKIHNPISEMSTKNKLISQGFNNHNSNIYFAENDLDYLVSKKIRETEEKSTEAFSKIDLTQKRIEEKNKIKKLEKNKDHWKTKLELLLNDLKEKIFDNPKDYDFYFKDAIFEFKQELISQNIISPGSYHLDRSEFGKDIEKLHTLENKTLDEIEKKILKNNQSKMEKEKKISPEKHDLNIRETDKMINDTKLKIKEEVKLQKDLNLHKLSDLSTIKIGNKSHSDNNVKNKNIKVETLNVVFKPESKILGIQSKKMDGKSSPTNVKELNESKSNKIKNVPLKFKFKQQNKKAGVVKSEEDIDNKSLLSDLLKSLD